MDQGFMDPYFGLGPWTTFIDLVQVVQNSAKIVTRTFQPMVAIVHKYLVVLT